MPTSDALRRSLSHVLWICGSTDSSTTSIARGLAGAHGLQAYQFERHEMEYFTRVDPRRHPALYAAHPDRMSPQERWLGDSPEEMARTTIACWTERFDMAIEDLLAMPRASAVVAEGPGFFPDCVSPLIDDPRRAIWLVPTERFKRDSLAGRGKPGSRAETTDPDRATRNLIERDLLMGSHIEERAGALGSSCGVSTAPKGSS